MRRGYRRYFLKARRAKTLLKKASRQLGASLVDVFGGGRSFELLEAESAEIFLVDREPLLIKVDEKVFPVLTFKEIHSLMPKVVVDMGAVGHICNGANVMAPGVVRYEGTFKTGDFVFVVDESHLKPIAVGEALHDVDVARSMERGVVTETIHFVGDRLWALLKELKATR